LLLLLLFKKEEEKEEAIRHQEERNEDLWDKVNKMASIIPSAFYIRVFVGFAMILLLPVSFYVICVVAIKNVVSRNEV
jgi:hypothetical protein